MKRIAVFKKFRNSYLSHRNTESLLRVSKVKIVRLIHYFSVWPKTVSNPEDIYRLRSHTGKAIIYTSNKDRATLILQTDGKTDTVTYRVALLQTI